MTDSKKFKDGISLAIKEAPNTISASDRLKVVPFLSFPILEIMYKETIINTDKKEIMESMKIKVKMASGLSKKLPHSMDRITKYMGDKALDVKEKDKAKTMQVILKISIREVMMVVIIVTFFKSAFFSSSGGKKSRTDKLLKA